MWITPCMPIESGYLNINNHISPDSIPWKVTASLKDLHRKCIRSINLTFSQHLFSKKEAVHRGVSLCFVEAFCSKRHTICKRGKKRFVWAKEQRGLPVGKNWRTAQWTILLLGGKKKVSLEWNSPALTGLFNCKPAFACAFSAVRFKNHQGLWKIRNYEKAIVYVIRFLVEYARTDYGVFAKSFLFLCSCVELPY